MQVVISNRRAGKFTSTEKKASRDAIAAVAKSLSKDKVVSDQKPHYDTGRRKVIYEATEGQMKALQNDAPEDVIIEPVVEYQLDKNALGAFAEADIVRLDSGFPTGSGQTFTFEIRGGGQPLPNAEVYLVARPRTGRNKVFTTTSDPKGQAVFTLTMLFQPLMVVVVPYSDFWPMERHVTGNRQTVVCPPLPSRRRLAWWHHATGCTAYDETAGKGIRVGVIDSGFGPHPDLNGTAVGAFIDNRFDPDGGADVDKHGTHVAGTIAGKPGAGLRFAGMAPGVELVAVRVFPKDGNAKNPDIAAAIDFLSREHKCDLINMSLGAPSRSGVIDDAIQDSFERGTLCICAAGNSSGPVMFPAAFEHSVAISAAGKLGEAPEGSVSAGKKPQFHTLFGLDQLFFANFSCFGDRVDSIGPGVGIIAPVPARHGLEMPYGAMDGTSMASPIMTGTLARALAKDYIYTSSDRDLHRATLARSTLAALSKPIGLPPEREGRGMAQE